MIVAKRYNTLTTQKENKLNDILNHFKCINPGSEGISVLHGYFENAKLENGVLSFKIMDFTFFISAKITGENNRVIIFETYEQVNYLDRLSELHKQYGYPETLINISQLEISFDGDSEFCLSDFTETDRFYPAIFYEYCTRLIAYVDTINKTTQVSKLC